MVQIVYVLELAQPTGYARVHFAQTLGAAQRAVRKHRPVGAWRMIEDDPKIKSRLLEDGRELARVVREEVEYF